ncbi:hypothetical protein Tco_0012064 [Tanacetum coccineum]
MNRPREQNYSKNKIRIGHEAAVRLQEELIEEERQRMPRVHEAAQSFTKEEWENIRARVESDEELTQRLQAEEINKYKYSEVDQAKMLVDLINQRKRYFAAQKVKAKRNIALDTYIAFLMELNNFETTMKNVNTFVPMEIEDRGRASELAARSSKAQLLNCRSSKEEISTERAVPEGKSESKVMIRLERTNSTDRQDTLKRLSCFMNSRLPLSFLLQQFLLQFTAASCPSCLVLAVCLFSWTVIFRFHPFFFSFIFDYTGEGILMLTSEPYQPVLTAIECHQQLLTVSLSSTKHY